MKGSDMTKLAQIRRGLLIFTVFAFGFASPSLAAFPDVELHGQPGSRTATMSRAKWGDMFRARHYERDAEEFYSRHYWKREQTKRGGAYCHREVRKDTGELTDFCLLDRFRNAKVLYCWEQPTATVQNPNRPIKRVGAALFYCEPH